MATQKASSDSKRGESMEVAAIVLSRIPIDHGFQRVGVVSSIADPIFYSAIAGAVDARPVAVVSTVSAELMKIEEQKRGYKLYEDFSKAATSNGRFELLLFAFDAPLSSKAIDSIKGHLGTNGKPCVIVLYIEKANADEVKTALTVRGFNPSLSSTTYVDYFLPPDPTHVVLVAQ